ncbi:MAG: sulfatase-like hydrolase/transferase [Myxococcota bacterium]
MLGRMLSMGCVLLLSFSCSSANESGPDILIVTWSSVRADHVGGSNTPVWNELASRSAVFTQTRTPSPITLPAHASIMTGQNPPVHGARNNRTWPLIESVPTLAERFKDAGWATGAFVSTSTLDSRNGIARGFNTYNDHIRPSESRGIGRRSGTDTVTQALEWLTYREPNQPLFLWVHLFDAHGPREESTNSAQSAYETAIAKADTNTGILLDALEARGSANNSIIVIASDHGEGLGEHGESSHGYFAYDSTVRVPMMLHIGEDAGATPTNETTVSGSTSLIDIAPTLLSAAKLAPMKSAGVNLMPFLHGKTIPPRNLTVETVLPELDFNAAPIFGVYDKDQVSWYDLPTPERYRLDSDPKQLINRFHPKDEPKAQQLFQKFDRRWPPEANLQHLSDEEQKALEDMSYVQPKTPEHQQALADPKLRINLFELLTQTPDEPATQLLERANAEIQKHGPVPALMLFKSDILDAIGRPVDALHTISVAALAHPNDKELATEQLHRKRKLAELRKLASAIQQELEQSPNDLVAQKDLALTLHRLQDFDGATKQYRSILQQDPGNDEARLDLARIFAAQDKYQTALALLAPALQRPGHPDAVDCLAGRLMSRGMGRAAEAEQLLAKCE